MRNPAALTRFRKETIWAKKYTWNLLYLRISALFCVLCGEGLVLLYSPLNSPPQKPIIFMTMKIPRIPRNLIREFFPVLLLWIAGDLYLTAKHLTPDSYDRLIMDLILLVVVVAAGLTAPASRTWEQLRWFLTAEVAGICLFVTLCHFAVYQSWKFAWLVALQATFWFCLARVCKLTLNTLAHIWLFALIPLYIVHNLALKLATTGITGLLGSLMENGAGPFVFAMMLGAIMFGFASVDNRRSKLPASPVRND